MGTGLSLVEMWSLIRMTFPVLKKKTTVLLKMVRIKKYVRSDLWSTKSSLGNEEQAEVEVEHEDKIELEQSHILNPTTEPEPKYTEFEPHINLPENYHLARDKVRREITAPSRFCYCI